MGMDHTRATHADEGIDVAVDMELLSLRREEVCGRGFEKREAHRQGTKLKQGALFRLLV